MAERPYLPIAQFSQSVPAAELELIVRALSEAIARTFAIEGTDPDIPLFPAIYSACVFPRIWGRLVAEFSHLPDWEVRKTTMTFTLVKRGVGQFHFYKGDKDKAFKAESRRQKAITHGLNYGDLDPALPSIILRHNSDKLKSQLISLQALFFEGGELKDALDILHKVHVSLPSIEDEINANKANEIPVLAVRFTRRDKSKKDDIAKREQMRVSSVKDDVDQKNVKKRGPRKAQN